MSDLIDRQVAIDAADSIIKRDTSGNNVVVNAMTAWRKVIESIPSAQPDRKKGKWRHYEGQYICEVCHAELDDISPFCPMCGADMRWEGEDEVSD